MISCPPAATVGYGSLPLAAGSASEFVAQGGAVSENCGQEPTVTSEDVSHDACPEAVTRTYTVTDACGNASTCEQTITINHLFSADPIVWHQPLARNGASEDTDPSASGSIKYRFKRGCTIPVEIHVLYCIGNVTSNPNIIGSVAVFTDSDCAGATGASNTPIDLHGVGGNGGMMEIIDGHLKYNLDTKSLSMTTPCFSLRVTVIDSSTGEQVSEEVLLQAK